MDPAAEAAEGRTLQFLGNLIPLISSKISKHPTLVIVGSQTPTLQPRLLPSSVRFDVQESTSMEEWSKRKHCQSSGFAKSMAVLRSGSKDAAVFSAVNLYLVLAIFLPSPL
jgi:hypothetical protein